MASRPLAPRPRPSAAPLASAAALLALALFASCVTAASAASCYEDNTQSSCKSFEVSSSEIQSNLTYLCESMPNMSGCTLRNQCNDGKGSGDYCEGFSLMADICLDMPTMNGCQGYNALCASGTVVKQCLGLGTGVPDLVGTEAAQADTLAACAAMVMDGCDTCSSAVDCAEPLLSLALVCADMSSMSQCSGLQTMCTQGDTASAFPTICAAYTGGATTSTVSMRMWLHASMKEMILMQPWTVRRRGPYIGSCIAVIFAAILVQFLKAIRVQIEVSWAEVWRGGLPHCGDGVVCNGGGARRAGAAARAGSAKAMGAAGGMRCGVDGRAAGCCSVPGNAAGSCCEMKSIATPAEAGAAGATSSCCGGVGGACSCGPNAACGGGSAKGAAGKLSSRSASGSSDGSQADAAAPAGARGDLEAGRPGDSPDVSSDSEEEIEALPPCCRGAAIIRRDERAARRAAQAARRRARRTGLAADGRPQTPGEPLLGAHGHEASSSHASTHGVVAGTEHILRGISAASLAAPPLPPRRGFGGRALGFLRVPAPIPTSRGVFVRNCVRSALTGITVFLDYMLMLIVMTFNIGIIVSAVIGFMLGTFFFGHWGERPTLAARDLSSGVGIGDTENRQVEFVEGGACCGGRV